ncbi:MAG: hypothetical protein A2583_00850 [Bdellovibrionales bacterium RIFOXYD1_FULL_53_11]|nr:MAG: hypothetical protein A2583_00850 [Bdellovibrionales bacterium RIFOXYD1_FULL_53_11]
MSKLASRALMIGFLPFFCSCASTDTAPAPPPETGLQRITIVALNDFHGFLAPKSDIRSGAALLAAHIKALRSRYGSSLLVLDAGDQMQGAPESEENGGKPTIVFFNMTGLDASALGNHDLEFRARLKEAKYPFLSANVRGTHLPNVKPSVLLTAGGTKIGVIGITTLDAPHTTKPGTTKGLIFTKPGPAIARETAKLRSAGAKLIVLLLHVGLSCDEESCNPRDEASIMLSSLPKASADLAITGHTHTYVNHRINGIPVVQAGFGGDAYSIIHLYLDEGRKEARPELTRVESPVRVSLPLYGQMLTQDPAVTAMLKPFLDRIAGKNRKTVGTAEARVEFDRNEESALGNLVADAIREKAGTQVAVYNAEGMRASLPKGKITLGDIKRSLPFDNVIVTAEVTGAQLKIFMCAAQSGAYGIFPVSGLRIKLRRKGASVRDYDGDGRIAAWETDRMESIALESGTGINDHKTYTIAMPDYIAEGGNGMKWAMSRIPVRNITNTGDKVRGAVIDKLKKAGTVGGADKPLADRLRPRISF